MYQLIPSLTTPLATLGDSHVLTVREVGFRPTSLARGSGFELEKFSTVLKENARTSRFVSKKLKAASKQVSLCCFISEFLYLYLHRPFFTILIKFSDYPKVIFANAISSLKL